MSQLAESVRAEAGRLNAPSAIQARVSAGRISRAAPYVLIAGRSAFLLAAQALVALLFLLRRDGTPWASAGNWWTVYGTLADLGCLALLWRYSRREGVSLRSLLGPVRWRGGRDAWLGLGLCLLIFPLMVAGGMLANWLFFGSFVASTAPIAGAAAGASAPHVFPLWRTLYSLCVWWIVWTPTEQLTYQGFALPRLQALTGRTWIALAWVGFWWSLQHSFLPFVPEWHYVAVRFVMVAPGILVTMLIYLRMRRLTPMIVAQWPMDILVALMTTTSVIHR